jgi:hypothetical protein
MTCGVPATAARTCSAASASVAGSEERTTTSSPLEPPPISSPAPTVVCPMSVTVASRSRIFFVNAVTSVPSFMVMVKVASPPLLSPPKVPELPEAPIVTWEFATSEYSVRIFSTLAAAASVAARLVPTGIFCDTVTVVVSLWSR